ncbi:MAG: winged helix DNA-binding domain-containing protein [Geodermatophilaceae bacterium]|nr:winged helix DNA-binding domain-containing protein [Geodermatophilaceae bacterium]
MTRLAGLSWAEVCTRRLDRHQLISPRRGGSPADAVAAMCGAHAQMPSAAELSIGLRCGGVSRADVRAALWTQHSLVRTFGPRGTVHLLAAADLPMWTGALAAVPQRSGFPADVRLTLDQVEDIVAVIGRVLDGARLTVDEMTAAIVAALGPWAGDLVMPAFNGLWPRWRQAIQTAAYRGVLCFGPSQGRNVTFTSPARWLPGFQPADPETALADLLRRYLHAYGPATSQHFAQWLNAPRSWASALFDSLGDRLESVEVEGTPGWVTAGDSEGGTVTDLPRVRLLPYFDPYVVGGQPRSLLFPGRAAEGALSGGQAGTLPVLLVDGTVAGVWHHRVSGRLVDITVEPFGDLDAQQRRELADQVARIGDILEGSAQLSIGTVAVGAHA